MSEHRARVVWKRATADFDYDTFNREHAWHLGKGVEVPASSAPEFSGSEECVDPEQGFVASLSSCHMLTFLAIAARKRFTPDEYVDDAVGTLEKNAEGKMAVTKVTLRPRVTFSGERQPTREELDRLHAGAHRNCFIANSIKTEVEVEPVA